MLTTGIGQYKSTLDVEQIEVKIRNYPKGGDGLYDKGLQGYIYGINYDIKLVSRTLIWGRNQSGEQYIGMQDKVKNPLEFVDMRVNIQRQRRG